MPTTLIALSGSPYAWRVWLALEHKGVPSERRWLSYDAGDFQGAELAALNPRRRVPVLVEEDGFTLYESAAIVEYLEDRYPDRPRLFSADARERALQRRMVREADQYFAAAMEHLVEAVLFTPKAEWSDARIGAAAAAIRRECEAWETMIAGAHLAGATVSAVDHALFPQVALIRRISARNPGLLPPDLAGPKLTAWADRMASLPIVQETWPPHWRG
ncbi:MAG TPA: glutathione S-transferase family protein [Myxococcota bacterium]|nr:glutathione S-transferase family protein [Myxococcota bacterium]